MENPNSKDPKLEWMYKGTRDLINREDYLLGRSVDKNYEILNAEEQKDKESHLFGVTVPKNHVEYECIPFSIREYRSLQCTDQVDIQRKILEDPLMAIKQKEIESRRKLLENPVKLKELHNILKMEKLKKSSKKRKSKKSKSKKKKKKSSRSSKASDSDDSDSDSEKDLDKLLTKKYKKVKSSLDDNEFNSNMDFEKFLNNKFEKLSKELDHMTRTKSKKSKKKRKHRTSTSTSESSSTSSSSESDEKSKKTSNRSKYYDPKDVRRNFITRHLNINSRPKPYYRQNLDERISRQNYRRSNSKDKRNYSSRDRRSKSQNKDHSNNNRKGRRRSHSTDGQETNRNNRTNSINREEISRNQRDLRKYSYRDGSQQSYVRNKTEFSGKKRERDSSTDRQRNQTDTKSTNPFKRQLTEDEKEKLRQQMMQNGATRDEERTNKVREYRKKVEVEESNQKSNFDRNFADKERKKAYTASTSIESRIKSNLNNIQRTSRAMDSNFARK